MITTSSYAFIAVFALFVALIVSIVMEFAKALDVPIRQTYGVMRKFPEESDAERRLRQRPRDIMWHVITSVCVMAVLFSMASGQSARNEQKVFIVLPVLYSIVFVFGVLAGPYIERMQRLWDEVETEWQRERQQASSRIRAQRAALRFPRLMRRSRLRQGGSNESTG